MKPSRGLVRLAFFASLAFLPRVGFAEAPSRTAVTTTPHFAFFSDVDTNLNDALIAAGLARKDGKPEIFRAGSEAPCFDRQPPPVRAAWNSAVAWYQEFVSPGGFGGEPQFLIRMSLAGLDDEAGDADARQFLALARAFRAAATPAYTECHWAGQDEKNRRFIEALRLRLATWEARMAPRLEQLYEKRSEGLPIVVDIVETVDWSGANTILLDPVGGHILISSANPEDAALEVVFHEASHIFMGRGAPVRAALDAAAKTAGFNQPGDLWHVVLFFTTGEAVRRVLEEGGAPGYRPMLYGIFDRGGWVEYRSALEKTWRPYVAGKRSLADASADLMKALRTAPPPGAATPKAPGTKGE
jgi:hypothetical protein